MTSVRPPAHARPAAPRTSRSQLLEAARLGATVARADLTGRPQDATSSYASWRSLRRRATTDTRQLLRVAFDTGYGRAMQTSGLLPH